MYSPSLSTFCSNLLLNQRMLYYLVFKLGVTFGDIEGMKIIWFECEKLFFPFISLSFCRLLIGSAVTIVLHAIVQGHANNFIFYYYIKANFIKFDLVVIFQGQVVKSKPRAIILGVP